MDRRTNIKLLLLSAGGLVLSGAFLTACVSKSDPQQEWKPAFFNDKEWSIIKALADLVIPAGDSPSASESGVLPALDWYYQECAEPEIQEKLHNGLAKLQNENFLALSLLQQQDYLEKLEEEERKLSDKHESFLVNFKKSVLRMYFYNQAGATKALDYVQTPGPYQGCIPLTKNQKVWTLNGMA